MRIQGILSKRNSLKNALIYMRLAIRLTWGLFRLLVLNNNNIRSKYAQRD